MTDRLYFAIGDIHGELQRLKTLHEIAKAHIDTYYKGRPFTLVHLGDLIDRGPDSPGVLDYLIDMHNDPQTDVITVAGNHDFSMVDHFSKNGPHPSSSWLKWGGQKTLDDYARRGESRPPDAHLKWIEALPTWHYDKAQDIVFVHAGIDPMLFPLCSVETRLWTRRKEFFDVSQWHSKALAGTTVIHGHTPTHGNQPEVAGGGRRINVDTGAVFGGKLTGVFIGGGITPEFLSV